MVSKQITTSATKTVLPEALPSPAARIPNWSSLISVEVKAAASGQREENPGEHDQREDEDGSHGGRVAKIAEQKRLLIDVERREVRSVGWSAFGHHVDEVEALRTSYRCH